MTNLQISFHDQSGLLRRQTFNPTPNMLLRQLVAQICDKHHLGDPSDWALKHGRILLDLSLSMRFANLAPGAKLELVKQGKKSSSNGVVNVVLQFEDGKRLVHPFPSNTTLWDILVKIEHDESINITMRTIQEKYYYEPVCNVLQKEIIGLDELNRITLASLGVVSGGLSIRVYWKKTDVLYLDFLELVKTKGMKSTLPSESSQPLQPSKSMQPVLQQAIISSEHVEDHMVSEGVGKEEPGVNDIDRALKVYVPSENLRIEDVPESFYELTTAELTYFLAVHRRNKPENEHFVTKTMKEKEQVGKLTKYPKCLIRVRFPDGMQIEASFLSIEPGSHLYSFIRNLLVDQTTIFHLRTLNLELLTIKVHLDHLRRIINDSSIGHLYDFNLGPSCLLHFSQLGTKTPFLRQEVMKLAQGHIPTVGTTPVSAPALELDENVEMENSGENTAQPSSSSDADKTTTVEKKKNIPKWLKLNKK